MKKLNVSLVVLGLAGILSQSVFAADPTITFGGPSTFTSNSAIISDPLVYAVSLGSASDITGVGTQGITFQADASNGSNGNVLFTPNSGTVATYNSYLSGGGTSGDAAFDSVLNNGFYNGTVLAGTTITLNNLTANRKYTVELFVSDTRAGSSGNTFTVTSGGVTTTPTVFAYNTGTPALGAYVVGTFTAAGTSESFQEDVYLGGDPTKDDFQVNAIVLDVANYGLSQTPGLTPNQLAVAQNLDQASLSGSLGAIITQIGNSTPDVIATDLNQLSPQKLQVMRNIAFDNFGFEAVQLDDHLASLRYGQGGLDASGLQVLDSSMPGMLSQIKGRLMAWEPASPHGLLSDSTNSMMSGVDTKEIVPVNDQNRWSTFISGNVITADATQNADISRASYTTGAVTAGADYRLNNNWAVGGLFAYGHTNASTDSYGSKTSVNSYSPGVYATYADHGWFANGLFAYNYNSYSESRVIPVAGATAYGSPNGNQYNGNLDGGYEFRSGDWTFGPTAALQYVHLNVDGFTETGAGAVNLAVNEQNVDSLRSRLGAQMRYNWSWYGGKVTATPHLSASWQHEYLDNSYGITSQFSGQGLGSFTVNAVNPQRDSAMLDAGFDTQWNSALNLFVDYQAQVGQSNFFAQSIQGGVKVSF